MNGALTPSLHQDGAVRRDNRSGNDETRCQIFFQLSIPAKRILNPKFDISQDRAKNESIMRVAKLLGKLLHDQRGTQTTELAIICAMIIIGLISAVSGVAEENSNMWNLVSSSSVNAGKN
jgi:Flp pilus assembly pilin Flp